MNDRFTDNRDGTISDHMTGLIWQKSEDGIRRNWADANQYCEDLVLGGYSDWRLPRIDELRTIVDYSRYAPAIDPVFGCCSYISWSNSTIVALQVAAWYVDFNVGSVGAGTKTYDGYYVRCVRGGPFWSFDPSDHLETSSPTTVRDTYWGYMWQRGDIGDTGLSWDQAKSYCDGLKLDGYTDWRLPEIEALQTIVDYSRFGPALSTNVLHGRSGVYWSGSTDVDDPDAAWNVHFLNGRVSDLDDKADSYYCVRCVRGGAGNAQATVSFTPPAHGGSPNSSYTVTSSHGAKTTTGASSPITVTGLANGSAYTFTVEATNAIGAGAASSPSNSVMPDGYVNNGDGTVTANQTGLMWQKADDGVYRNWADAGQYCENLDLGGHDDWRLPNIDELKTLVDRSRSPTIDPVFSCKLDYYWSRSTDVYDPDNECLVYFRDGEVDAYTETYYGGYVRCVRRTLII